MNNRLWVITGSILLVIQSACAYQSAFHDVHRNSENSLYLQLGGEVGIDELVVDAIHRIHQHERLAFLFEDVDFTNLVEQIRDQICYLSGGPCTYEGLSMTEVHAGQDITKAEFDIFVKLFRDAMDNRKIPFSAQNKLLAKLAPMRPDIIRQ